MRRRAATVAVTGVLLLTPLQGVPGALAATPKRKVSTTWKQVLGPLAQADRWGDVRVLLVVRKRVTTIGTKRYVARRITAVRVPVFPTNGASHTIGLNRRVIPLLAQEVLREQFATEIQIVSEATDTSLAFDESLQAALVKARRV